MNYQTIEVAVADGTATVWLNRPDVRNAMNETVIDELRTAFEVLGRDESVRVVVLAGRGSAFCAGADLHWMKRMADFSEAENESDAMRIDPRDREGIKFSFVSTLDEAVEAAFGDSDPWTETLPESADA